MLQFLPVRVTSLATGIALLLGYFRKTQSIAATTTIRSFADTRLSRLNFDLLGSMQTIQRERAGGNMSMIEWREAMERRTDVNLGSFWREWVLDTGAPSKRNLYPGNL